MPNRPPGNISTNIRLDTAAGFTLSISLRPTDALCIEGYSINGGVAIGAKRKWLKEFTIQQDHFRAVSDIPETIACRSGLTEKNHAKSLQITHNAQISCHKPPSPDKDQILNSMSAYSNYTYSLYPY